MIDALLTVVGDTIQRVNSVKPPGARPKLSSSSDVLSKGEQGEKRSRVQKEGGEEKGPKGKKKKFGVLKRLERESSMMRRSHKTSRITRFGKVAGRATSCWCKRKLI